MSFDKQISLGLGLTKDNRTSLQLSNGNIVFSYNEGARAWISLFNENGVRLISPIQLSSIHVNLAAIVKATPDGGWLACWYQPYQASGAYIQRFQSDGSKLGNEIYVSGLSLGSAQSIDTFDILSNGNFLLTKQAGSPHAIVGYEVNSLGQYTTLDLSIADGSLNGSDGYWHHSVQPQPNGGFNLVWTGRTSSDSDSIFLTRYGSTGAVISSSRIDTGSEIKTTTPTIAPTADGGSVIFWSSFNGTYEIYGRKIGANGQVSGVEMHANTTTAYSQLFPVVTVLKDGGWVVAWISYLQDGSEYGSYLRRYDSSGVAVTSEIQISSESIGNQDTVGVFPLNNGGWIATYASSGNTVESNGLYAVRFDANSQKIAFNLTVASPTYSLSATSSSVNEGSTATFTLTTTNVTSGTSVPYTLSGISAADISGGSLSGNAVVNSSGIATISVTLLNDLLTEGSETLTLTINGVSASTTINDTSKAAVTPSYSLIAWSGSTYEGYTASFTLTTTNVAAGTSVPYTLSGISAADVSGGSLSGNAVVNSSGVATISVTLLNDSLTEGSETLTVSAGGATASTVVNDTSTSPSATYSISSSSSSVNEGSSVTFTLTTNNVAAGTSVSYTLSGISSADLASGSLSGTTTVASNGQATISVLLANDNLTEGTETLTITAGGASASAQINDTSRSASPTYSISTNWTSTTEGTPIVVTLSTTNVSAGTTLYYQLSGSGITSSDFGGLSLSGSSVINSSGQASLTISLSADTTTEGDETFVIQYYTDSGRSITAGSAAYVTIQDTSKGAVTPTYAVSANNSSVNEGSTADFTITTSNVSAGSSISYTLSGVSSSDITGGALTGNATVNSSGIATVSVPIAADSLTEGTETLTFSLQGRTASVLINDTSKAAAVPTYDLVASGSSVNEGSVATFNLTTTGVSPGTSVAYTISGVSSSDVTGGLNGTATVDTNGLATISVPIAADFLTEGAETLTVTSQGKSASISVNDTSKTTLVASYALAASTNSVSEGSNAVFTLTTTNVAGGTSIAYTISGVSASDITGGALSGTAIVSSSGNATITIPIASDLTTEGTESLTVTAQGISSSVLISDASTTPVVVTPISTVTSIPYGDGKYFYGSSGPDKVTGTSFVDVVKQTSTISSNQLTKLSDGSWQVQNKITPSNSDNLVNVERIEFSDMSVALDVSGPAGQVAKILGSVFGQSYVSNTVFAGMGFAYLDGGMSYLDLCGLAASAAGLSTPDLLVTKLLTNTAGPEPTPLSKSNYLQLIASGASYASIVQQIADSSANAQSIKLADLANSGLPYTPYIFPPTYSLSATTTSVNEGSTAFFNLTTTNVAVGTEVSYTLSGVSPSDLTTGIAGKVSIGVGGVASISVPIAADGVTEGQETLTVNAQGATASIVINDTSKSAATPTYSLIAESSSIDEGASVRVTVNTTNVAPGTSLEYGISGINITTDDLQGGLKGIAVVDSFGMALINLFTLADLTTEGSETMVITMGKSDTQVVINDTSITLVGITDGSGGDGGGGGGGGGSGE